MSTSNDQGNGAAFIYCWDAGGQPIPDAQGRYGTLQNDPNSALPVFLVTGTPVEASQYPDDQGLISNNPPQGAWPIKLVGMPTPDASGRFPTDQSNANSAIPIWFANAAPAIAPAYPNSKGDPGAAIPVWIISD